MRLRRLATVSHDQWPVTPAAAVGQFEPIRSHPRYQALLQRMNFNN
jgi:hypothetical protein